MSQADQTEKIAENQPEIEEEHAYGGHVPSPFSFRETSGWGCLYCPTDYLSREGFLTADQCPAYDQ